ncbi:hypothetical protein PUNSTDRAFT_67063, partial [Punctularia strigosozonata HHB-11173 SS5]|uniref:uncharacterized protein n=1 Tax=Punctularia strigosozonata (strain HHB-11173) TaxID=741275 RepID=UPI000441837A
MLQSLSLEDHDRTLTRVTKLARDGENFATWKPELREAISAKGHLRYIDGRAIQPVKPSPLGANATQKETDQYNKDLEAWDTKYDAWVQANSKVRTMLFSTIHETLKIKILSLTTAQESWDTLVALFENQGDL